MVSASWNIIIITWFYEYYYIKCNTFYHQLGSKWFLLYANLASRREQVNFCGDDNNICFERTCRVEFLQCKYLYVAPRIPNRYTEILHSWSTTSNHSSKCVSICLYSWIHTGDWICTLLVKEWVVVLLPVVFRHIYMDFFI
jgi:hypothetical protein